MLQQLPLMDQILAKAIASQAVCARTFPTRGRRQRTTSLLPWRRRRIRRRKETRNVPRFFSASGRARHESPRVRAKEGMSCHGISWHIMAWYGMARFFYLFLTIIRIGKRQRMILAKQQGWLYRVVLCRDGSMVSPFFPPSFVFRSQRVSSRL